MKKISNCHLQFANERGIDKTFCPSEVARSVFPNNWREKMDLVREAADLLVKEGTLVVMQNGQIKEALPSDLKGPIRLRINKKS